MKVIIISLDQDLDELINLTDSLNYDIQKIFLQKRPNPNPKFYIGGGKVKEIKEYVNQNEVDIVIINAKLKASQFFNLERSIDRKIYDRIRLILEIFQDRAYSREAKLQVELARLQYEIPLVNEWIHRSKKGEHPGFLAGGEYAVNQYYDLIRKRIKRNKDKLLKLRKEREFRRSHRKKHGFHLVSIAGYTNAGKSTLLNRLTESSVVVEKRVFSTLMTTTRKLKEGSRQILLTDTVGFIKDLPPWLIEAFHSTLEEIFYSDIILLLVDISEDLDEVVNKINTCFQILWNSDNVPKIIVVFNKIDLDNLKNVRNKIKVLKEQKLVDDYIYVSSKENLFIPNLIDKIHESLPELVKYKIEIFSKKSKSLIDYLEEIGNIVTIKNIKIDKNIPIKIKKEDLLDNIISIDFECDEKHEKELREKVKKLRGIRLTSW